MQNEIKKYNKSIKSTISLLKFKLINSLLHLDKKRFNIYRKRIKSLRKIQHQSKINQVLSTKRIAVYTALYGDYDRIKTDFYVSNNCDYFIFTDNNATNYGNWKKVDFSFPKEVNTNVLKNRYLKMHPHLLFPNYEYSIYLDATLIISHDISLLLNRMENKVIGMYSHEETRNCTYEEALVVIKSKKAPKEIVESQMKRYFLEGFPREYGLTENCIIVRKHNDIRCISIMSSWWSEFSNPRNSKRDQLCFMYVLWKNGLSISDVALLGYGYYDDPMFVSENHRV